MDAKLAELAKQAIVELQEDKKQLKERLELEKVATSLTFKLFEMGVVQAEDLESKLAEFKDKSTQELEVIEKAAELSKTSGFADSLSLGNVSDRPQDDGTLDPLTSYLLEEYH